MGADFFYLNLVENVAMLLTICVQLTPLPTILAIVMNGSTEDHSPFFFLCSMLGSWPDIFVLSKAIAEKILSRYGPGFKGKSVALRRSGLWLTYGLVAGFSSRMITVLALASFSDAIYVSVYFFYCKKQEELKGQICLVGGILMTGVLFTNFLGLDRDTVLFAFGFVVCIVTALLTAAPLLLVRDVLRFGTSEPLPLLMIVLTFLVSLVWLVYGVMVGDKFIQVQNGISVFLGLVQLPLLVLFPRGSRVLLVSWPTRPIGMILGSSRKEVLLDATVVDPFSPEIGNELSNPHVVADHFRASVCT
ncbi:unnamed protein product [Notodromas monacha]|uniref:Sugar transporter SWEET n=1 Tax=Notodromas monacha TaxID=399045 RepID=A0A7R9G9T7_9CRUS|nr:unnamed protein product [Notodromas monacha]CAG0914632.1 unnamed protein product [Notodromas monacha]